MTMCDPYDLEHPDCETTKMTKQLDLTYYGPYDLDPKAQTLPVDTNEQPGYLLGVYHAVNVLQSPYQSTFNGEVDYVHPSSISSGHSILEKRTRPLELVPGESEYNEDELHDWDNPFLTEPEKHFYVETPESVRKRKEWKKKMAEQKHSNEYYTGDVDPYINGIPKGLKQKQGYDIGEMAMRISEAEREKEKGIRDFLDEYTKEVIKPRLKAEKLAKEHSVEKVHPRKETDPRMSAWERRKYVEDDKNKDKAVLKEHLTKIIEKTLDHAMERRCMWCQIPSSIATDYPEDLLKVIPTHKDRDAVLNELFEEYRELGYRVDLLGSTCITPKEVRYGWMDGVAFNWGDDEDYEEAMSNVMEIDLSDDDDSPVMSEETIQWIDFEKMKPPKYISLYLIKYLNVDGLEHINIYWWNSDNDDNEWRFNLSPLAGVKILAWSNIPLSRKPE